jgi:hypothetical protein
MRKRIDNGSDITKMERGVIGRKKWLEIGIPRKQQ